MTVLRGVAISRLLLSFCLAPLGEAFGQAPPMDSALADSAARKLKAVVVSESRAAGSTGGASAVVVKPEHIRSSPAPLLEQALRESPFVHVRQNSRGEMELSMRGSDSRQAAVLLDGVPITLGFDHRTDPSLIPLTGAQNLVIVRGLASLLHGPNTLGGTVEVSHDDAFARLGTGRIWGGAGVDENAAWVAAIGGGRELATSERGSVSLRAGVAHRKRDGFALPSAAPDPTASRGLRTNSDLLETDAFAALRWSRSGGSGIGLMLTGFNAERGVPPEEHISAPRLWRYPYHSRAIAGLSASSGGFRTPLGFGSIDLAVGLNSGRTKIESYSDRSYQTVTGAELGDERTWTGRAVLSHSLVGAARVKFAMTGADISYDELLPPAAVARYQQRLMSGGAEIDVPVTGRTSVAAGLVYDRSTSPLTGGRAPGQAPFDAVGWRAGITHDPNTEWRLHANASRRARFPSLRELYSGALNRFLPNPRLRPETLLGLEAGVTVDRSFGPIPDATVQLSAFHHDLKDAIVRTTLPAPDSRFFRVNRDRIRSSGAEILAGLVFGDDRAFSVTGDALVQKITLRDQTAAGQPSRHAENNPEASGMLEIGVPLPGRIRGFANARYTGAQYCLNSETGLEMRLAAASEVSFAAEKTVALSRGGGRAIRSLRTLLSIDNAANAVIYDQCGLPQPGRTVRVMFTFR